MRGSRWIAAILAIVVASAALIWNYRPLWPEDFGLEAARAAYLRRDWHEAADLAKRYLRERADDRAALRILARSSARLGRLDSSQALYQRLGDEGAEAEDYLTMGLLLRQAGDAAMAKTSLRTAIASNPDHMEARRELASLLLGENRPVEAQMVIRPATEADGREATDFWLLGRALLEWKDGSGAAAAFDRALKLDPALRSSAMEESQARVLIGTARLSAGRAREAGTILADLGDNPEVLFLSGRAAMAAGACNDATTFLDRARAGGFREETSGHDPSPYLGAAACGRCHEAKYRTQQSSRHARSLTRGEALTAVPLPGSPVDDPGSPGVRHAFDREGDRVRIAVTGTKPDALLGYVEYLMGSGDRGTTMVVRDVQNAPAEVRLSHYGQSGWDLTFGHPKEPDEATGFLGRPLSEDALDRCLSCHATTGRAARTGTGPEALDRGIGCESCHGPGGHHVAAVDARCKELAIHRPARGDAEGVIQLCGRCHAAAPNKSPTEAEYVRFQASTLVQSACYIKGAGKFDCLTCHDPHRDAETSARFYESRCLSCHEASKPNTVACRVSPATRCLECHMPVVEDAVPHTPFTDHWIRVHK